MRVPVFIGRQQAPADCQPCNLSIEENCACRTHRIESLWREPSQMASEIVATCLFLRGVVAQRCFGSLSRGGMAPGRANPARVAVDLTANWRKPSRTIAALPQRFSANL